LTLGLETLGLETLSTMTLGFETLSFTQYKESADLIFNQNISSST
jgi:hypothetical protein